MRHQPVRVVAVMPDQSGKTRELALGGYVEFLVGRLVDAVMEDTAFVAQRNGPLADVRLGFAHQEAAVDATAEEELRVVAAYAAVIPGKSYNI